MLVDWLRREARLTGVKVGCNAGACGACTGMVTEDGRDGGPPTHRPVLACLTPLAVVGSWLLNREKLLSKYIQSVLKTTKIQQRLRR